MAERITFQFDDDLDYQVQAVKSVVELFKGLSRQIDGIYRPNRIRKIGEGDPIRNHDIVTGSRLLKNLRQVQLQNDLFADSALAEGNNFTIEMETGTGKTYVYLRTILELYKEYGFMKFMIVVPSIAIRKGVEKSMEQLQDHFKRLYNIDLLKHSFIYDSNNPKQVSSKLVESNDLSICVMNIQAFNKDTNKIRTEDEYGQILWEDIKYIKPIIIIDEPQKIEGTKRNKSKSLKAIEELQPLFTLRYSATHKQLYNQIYKLDSYGAYQKDLVKRIEVKTVHGVIPKDYPYIRYLSFTSDLKAKIEIFSQEQGGLIRFKTFHVGGGVSIEELSGNLPQYKDMRIAEEPHKLKPLQVATKEKIIELEQGHSTYEIQKNEAVRIQIRLAIQNHFAKQMNILRAGKKIKVLTLFFIDSVDKVRDNTAPDGRGEYLRIFDEEYKKYVSQNAVMLEKFKEYFPDYVHVQSVREGYFALDAKKNAVEIEGWDSSVDEDNLKIKAKSQEDIDRGISLILEKKDELISFEEPLAFIFSHSALREGWDNPNVFTLCTLKSGGSEIAKKQEIGRGLRLPVDITGNRCLDRRINELTVIANDYYDHFAAALQKDFNDSMNFDKNEVTAEILISTLKNAGVPQGKITPELVDTLKEELISAGVMNGENILKGTSSQITKLFDNMTFVDDTLYEHMAKIKEQFKELMIQKGTKKIEIYNGDNERPQNGVRAFVSEGEFQQIYLALRENLVKRTMYKFRIDKDRFIDACASAINNALMFMKAKNEYKVEAGKAGFNESAQFVMQEFIYGSKELEVEMDSEPKSDFEIANYIMYHTMLPRLAIFKIINGIDKRKLLDNQDILDFVTQKILEMLNDAKAKNITSYEVINGYELDSSKIFETDTISEEDFNDEWKVFQANADRRSAMNLYYKMDSKGEKEFAQRLENNENVLLFTKLKKGGFVIDTPYGNYSPDWAIVCRKESLNNPELGIYFIVETKIDKRDADLQDIERNKIRCGELHFQAVSEQIKFAWVNSYEDFRQQFGVAESE
ncbi:MAG: DEAD/DEAH box helicase family protein [Lachnoclostridium sp.]|nr:DEAD/DEAH box helicase family protein [Lachnospira sp.]MCM1247148.1 DEAD/DEAH box helicase family protein [Lachnoclostridium sp.]